MNLRMPGLESGALDHLATPPGGGSLSSSSETRPAAIRVANPVAFAELTFGSPRGTGGNRTLVLQRPTCGFALQSTPEQQSRASLPRFKRGYRSAPPAISAARAWNTLTGTLLSCALVHRASGLRWTVYTIMSRMGYPTRGNYSGASGWLAKRQYSPLPQPSA